MKNPPPLETPAMTQPVSDSVPQESSASSIDAPIADAVEVAPERESDFILPPLLRDRTARFAAGSFQQDVVLFDGAGMSNDDHKTPN
jgi:hypothetical protein